MTDYGQPAGRLDLYVEKIVSYMNLDDAQREDVVRELRSHLEEAIEEGARRGMKREHAETVAMERFGDPVMLAGKFGTLRGKTWVVLEAVAYALLMFAFMQWQLRRVPDRPDFVTDTHLLLAAGAAAAFTLTARLWNRVQVNGSLRIYRFMRSTQIIPFDAITDVSLQRLHLMGTRRVNIQYGDGKKAQYSSGWPNARCMGIALEVLAPQAIKPRAAAFFRKLRLMAGAETLGVKIWLTVGWAVIAAGLATTFPLLWNAEGMSLAYGLVILGTGLWLWLQYYVHINRAKRVALLGLQTAYIIFLLPWSIYPLLATADTRPLVVLVAAVLPLPVVLLWLRSRNRLVLIALTVAWIAAGYSAAKWVPDNVKVTSRSLGVANGHISNAVWISETVDTNPAYAALGHRTKPRNFAGPALPMLTLTSDGETTDRALPAGSWSFVAGGQGSSLTLLARTIKKPITDPSPDDSEIYQLDEHGKLHKLADLSNTTNFLSSIERQGVTVSPDGRYYITTAVDIEDTATDTKKYRLAILDLETRQLSKLDDVRKQRIWRWATSSTLEMLVWDSDKAKEQGPPTYEVWRLNAATGELARTSKTLEFKTGDYISREISDNFGLIKGKSTFAIANLNTGTSISLPLPIEEYPEIARNSRLSRACYLSGDAAKQKFLVLAGPEGVIAKLPVADNIEAGLLQIAPDGNKVFYAARRTDGLMLSLGQLRVWDIGRNTDVKIGRTSMIVTKLAFMSYSSQDNYPRFQWTPDSRSVVWGGYDFGYNRTPTIGTEFRSLDYEDWAERSERF